MQAQVVVRPLRDGDEDEFVRVDELAFGYTTHEDVSPDAQLLDHSRSLIAEVDGEPVGIASSYPFAMSVPGGAALPTAGVTWVGVLPTHRRRGVLRAVMEHQIRSIAAAGEPLAALWASEAGIYGRYGYGCAATAFRVHIPSQSTTSRAPVDLTLRSRLLVPDQGRAQMEQLYAAEAATRPGVPSRSVLWWDRLLDDPASQRNGASAQRLLLVEDGGGARGYAVFTTLEHFDANHRPAGTLRVRELIASDPAARAQLWRVLLSHDLMSSVDWANMPIDDPVLLWLDDVRSVVGALNDQLWLRIVDLPAALASRTYSVDCEVVLDVDDALLPGNAGRWRLITKAGTGAACEPTTDPADLALDVRDLGAAYLGSTLLSDLALAGLVESRDRDLLTAVSNAFAVQPRAWCPRTF